MQSVFIAFQLVALVGPAVDELLHALRKDSPGGRRLTKGEKKKILRALADRLLSDEAEAALDAVDI